MKQKVRKLGLRFKILFPVTLIIIVICGTLGTFSFLKCKTALIEQGSEEALVIAKVAAQMIEPTQVQVSMAAGENSNAYSMCCQYFDEIKFNTGMELLFTLYTHNENVQYGIDSTMGDLHHAIGDEYKYSYDEMSGVFEDKEAFAESNIQKYEGKNIIYAYAPFYDNLSQMMGVVGCGYNADSIVSLINEYLRNIIIISVGSMIISIILVNLIISLILRSIKKVNRKIYDLANTDGDLTSELDIHTGDEMELISNNINSLLRYIRQIIINITEGSTTLRDSATIMAGNIVQSNDNINTISSTMQQIAAGCEETNASIESIKQIIGDTNDMVLRAYEQMQQTTEETKPIITSTETTYVEANKSREKAIELGKEMKISMEEKISRSREVEKINALTENILNISSQTNLLSLNASIEAARAGEAGKGFAVVANEISTLAKNSADAANEIQNVSKEIIEVVDSLSKEAYRMIEFLEETTNDGYGKLLSTSESYSKDISYMAEQLTDIADFCNALQSQFTQITDSMDAIEKASTESALGISDIAANTSGMAGDFMALSAKAEDVNNVSTDLATEVHKFKV